jgi:hypothetical protein
MEQHPAPSRAACRFCQPDPDDFLPCYASALVFPGRTGLGDAILDAEKDLVPCFTGYCAQCKNVRLLSGLVDEFPMRSAHHVHQIVLMRQLQAAGVLLK